VAKAKKSDDNDVVIIKKYANRRLYNTSKSCYVTLENLAEMVREGEDFVVNDAKSGEDITRSVLAQIIFEEEAKGHNMLPTNFLRQLIGLYGDTLQSFVPSYLETSMNTFTKNQEEIRDQVNSSFGENPAVATTNNVGDLEAPSGWSLRAIQPFRCQCWFAKDIALKAIDPHFCQELRSLFIDALNIAAIDLQEIKPELAQMSDGGMPRSKVIKRNRAAEIAQRIEKRELLRSKREKRTLCNLNNQELGALRAVFAGVFQDF